MAPVDAVHIELTAAGVGLRLDDREAYADPGLPALPRTLAQALDRFEASAAARAAFGDDFVEHFTAMKRWEDEQHRLSVSDWEIRHYVETA